MKKIGIISAMTSEVSEIREALGEFKIEKVGNSEFYIYEAYGKKIISICSGVGKINAAIATQMLISNFGCDVILNAGIAGGMNTDVKICDIVIASDVMSHDATSRFLEKYPPYCSDYKCDDKLIEIAQKACENNNISYFTKRVVSGEQFISDSAVKAKIIEEFNPYAVEMECSAVGQCAMINAIPFLAIKCISDNADEEGEMSFEEFEIVAAKRVAKIVMEMIEEI